MSNKKREKGERKTFKVCETLKVYFLEYPGFFGIIASLS